MHVDGDRPSDIRLIAAAREAVCGASLRVARDSATPLASDVIAGYRLIREIGHGGQGVVYLAEQLSTQRHVAIKMLRHGVLATASENARLEREVRVLAQLRHPGIVAIHDSGRAGTLSYLVMDYIEGVTLDEYMRTFSPPARDRIALYIQVAEAVDAAHRRGVIHRDLKPANVRVDAEGHAHVLDFGVAKLLESDSPVASLTCTGQFVGSLEWSAPEQVRGARGEVDHRTDVYALGVVFWHSMTGAMPYPIDGDTSRLLQRILSSPPVARGDARERMPRDVETILLRCLAKEPSRRYDTAGELAADLRRYLEGKPVAARRDSTLYVIRKTAARHRVVVALSGAVLLIALASSIGLNLMYQYSDRTRRNVEHANRQLREDLFAAVPSLPDLNISFDEPWNDSRFVLSPGASIRQGRLILDCTSVEDTAMTLLPSQGVLRGDFDISMDYEITANQPLNSGAVMATLRTRTVRMGSYATWLARYREHNPQCPGMSEDEYISGGDGLCPPAHVHSDDERGRLRLTRRGTTASTFYWANGWQLMYQEPITDDVLGVEFHARRILTDEPLIVACDRISIKTVFPDKQECLDELRDEFSGGVVDPRLTLQKYQNSPSEAGGKLLFIKLNGYSGETSCTLDVSRYALCGNFELSIDFELAEWPDVTAGSHFVRLALLGSPTGPPVVGVERVREGSPREGQRDFIRALGDPGETELPTQARRGRLFIGRHGGECTVGFSEEHPQELGRFPCEGDTFSFRLSTGATDSLRQHRVLMDNLHFKPLR